MRVTGNEAGGRSGRNRLPAISYGTSEARSPTASYTSIDGWQPEQASCGLPAGRPSSSRRPRSVESLV